MCKHQVDSWHLFIQLSRLNDLSLKWYLVAKLLKFLACTLTLIYQPAFLSWHNSWSSDTFASPWNSWSALHPQLPTKHKNEQTFHTDLDTWKIKNSKSKDVVRKYLVWLIMYKQNNQWNRKCLHWYSKSIPF